jgi:predicted transcriptional regulator
MPTEKKRVALIMPPDLHDLLQDLAEWRCTSVSDEIRIACLEYLARQEFPRRDDVEAVAA